MSEWSFLRTVLRGRRAWTGTAYLLLALTWAAGIGLLALSGWFITASALAGAGLLLGLELFTPSAGIRAAALLRTLARYGERVIGHEAVLRVLADLRIRSFAAIARLPAARQRALRSGDLQQRLTADIDTLDAVPLRITGPLVAAVLAIAAAAALAAWLAPWPAALLLVAGAVLTLATSLAAARAGQAQGRELIEQRSRQRVALLDYFGGLAELLAYRRIDRQRALLDRLEHDQAARLWRQERVAFVTDQAVQLLVAALTLAMLGLALHWHAQDRIDAPVAVLLTLMTLGLNEVLSTLPGALWRVGESLQAAGRLQQLGLTADEKDSAPAPEPASDRPAPAPDGTLEAQDLAIGFDPGRPLVAGLSFVLQPGRPLVIHGRSGVGKTTLLETLAGEREPLTGELRLAGRRLGDWPEAARYRAVGYLPQHTLLLDASIGENLRLGRQDLPDQTLWQALETVDLATALRREGFGLDYAVGEGGRRLSGGQARRLALAALLLRDTPVMLLDEPFSSLDPGTVKRVLQRIAPWLATRRVVIVTHAPETLPGSWPRLQIAPPRG
ncbi:Transport ATP-binding protein CydC [Thioalkalivibrio nitratireducens DSM 14787]|uniref:Transport ATP-binding protein CydC n=1 Tax=Thioalkalivibrio nitratireducens (strain DSM 14787 / UNIQEM 213 / ALEN2) TaxID=1255043 RepID=L0DYN9_THIND|nr:thiol reductant ABC exporter subunit CydC [Thioalkalivibrio nitratireducens]AGA34122.1 Transport ATP-binding protein CydC [Thioalkalivibrio nitratireducens DSM 14787]